MKKLTLKEALERLQELDFVPGVSMAVPDFDYTVARQRNFDPYDEPDEWPYEDGGKKDVGPPLSTGDTGQRGVGRGGVGWGGRSDKSGGVRKPSAAYDRTWDQDDAHMGESPDYDEEMRHGKDKYRNVWRDTPEGQYLDRLSNESMGSPMQIGPVAPMDGPQHDVLHLASGTEEGDPLAAQNNTGPAGQWGGPGMVPGQSRGWGASPTLGDSDRTVWRIPDEKEEESMKLREFFCPEPVPVEEIDNPAQDHYEDQSDDEIEDRLGEPEGHEEPEEGEEEVSLQDLGVEPGDGFCPSDDDNGFAGRLGGTAISIVPNLTGAGEFLMSPDRMGAARGTYGIHTDSKKPNDLVDKKSAWDVLQWVVSALGENLPDQDKEG